MFQPPIFRENRVDQIHNLMRSSPFASLSTYQSGRLETDHIPMMIHEDLSEKGILRGHIARGNPICRLEENSHQALVVFQGPQTYISPGWYPSKEEHGKAVPTWNYVVAHARGQLKLVKDNDWLLEHLASLSHQHEAQREKPWTLSDAPDEFITRQLKGIVGLEIEIEELDAVWKASQNKDARDKAGIVTGLRGEGTANAEAFAQSIQANMSD